MKKYSILLVICLLLGLFSGCGECEHEYSSEITLAPTCASEGEKTFTCKKCGETYTEPVAKSTKHTYSEEITKEATYFEKGEKTFVCTVCGNSYTETVPKLESKWELMNYTDSFKEKIADVYAVASFSGTFRNSATNSSNLEALVFLDMDSLKAVKFKLLEYGTHLATFSSSASFLLMEVKGSTDGTIETYYPKEADGIITFDSKDEQEFLVKFFNNEKVSVHLEDLNKYTSVNDEYWFTIENDGALEFYEETENDRILTD